MADLDLRFISLGAGVQSTAMIVLAAQKQIDYRKSIFADVGEDSENPATIQYLKDHLVPYMEGHGIEHIVVRKNYQPGGVGNPKSKETLLEHLYRQKSGIAIPVIARKNGMPGNRKCTGVFKVMPVAYETKRRKAKVWRPATVAIGISIDEYTRMSDSKIKWQVNDFPLIDLKMTRNDCEKVILEAGLPVPPKSSCWFCPFHTPKNWKELAKSDPELFSRSAELETYLSERSESLGRGPRFISSAGVPITEIRDPDPNEVERPCDVAGYCAV